MSSRCAHTVRLTRQSRAVALRAAFAITLLLSSKALGQNAQDSGPAIEAGISRPLQQPLDALPPPESQLTKPLTLAQLEQLALQNNPSLVVAAANVNAARGRRLQSGLRPNPTVGYLADDIGEDNTAGKQGAFVSKEFVTGGKLALNRAVGSKEVDEFRFRRNAQERRVLADVRMRFYEVLAAQRRMDMTQQVSDIGQKLTKSTQQLFQGQQVSQSDVLQAEVESGESDILAATAHAQNDDAWRRLAAVVGLSASDKRELDGKLEGDVPNYDWESAYTLLLSESPELGTAQARVERARLALERARRENIPNVNVMASVAHRNQNDFDVAGVQVGIPIPICNRNQGNIMAADAELVAAQNDVRRTELDLQQRLSTAFRRYDSARQQVTRYQNDLLPRAQKSLDLVEQGYRAGQTGLLVTLMSQRTYIRVNVAYIDALVELRTSAALIDCQLLSDSLQNERR
jgi:cobalt-zinc-cadmium efflux system outer membrane protein